MGGKSTNQGGGGGGKKHREAKKAQGGKSTNPQPGVAGGWCGVGSGGHRDRGSVEAEVRERLETVEKNPGPRRGGEGRLRRIGGRGGRGSMVGGGSIGRGGEG